MEADRNKLETFLTKHQDQLITLTDCLREAGMKLVKMEADKNETETSLIKHQLMLCTVRDRLEKAEMKLVKMETNKNESDTALICSSSNCSKKIMSSSYRILDCQ